MIKGFKCDYCSFFDTSYNTITDHEAGCYYDKKKKRCFTCCSYINLGEEIGEIYWVCEREEEHEKLGIPYDTVFYAKGCVLWVEK